MNARIYPKIFLAILGIVVLFLIKGFIIGIISGFVIAFLLLPIYHSLKKKIPKKFAAAILISSVILIIALPSYFIFSEITKQIYQYFNENSISDTINVFAQNIPYNSEWAENLKTSLTANLKEFLLKSIFSLGSSLPSILINAILSFFIAYYLLVNWDGVSSFITKLLPFKRKEKIDELKNSFYKIFHGLLIIAFLEFVIALIGFWIAGVKAYLVLALLIAIAAFIPLFGPIAIWAPLFIFYVITGNTFSAVVVLITGLILSVGIDNFLGHIIIGRTSKINPAIMFLGVLGGVSMFGIFGFIVGPLILVTFIELLKDNLEDAG